MKKITLVLLLITLLVIAGCKAGNQSLYLPEAEDDRLFTTIGGDEKAYQTKAGFHRGEGYTITVPIDRYHYEKEYDDGNLEETWDYTKIDDVEIKVTTYKNADEITARGKFLKDNDDYVFEDLVGYSLCGRELDGDTLWFHLYESKGTVYIVSWEYPKNTNENLKNELSDIAETFKLAD